MERSTRVLVIGLDGATWDVLDPWINDGSLPNLAKLRQNGCWGPLRSTLPPLTAAAWSTFMTGKRPGKHGVFHFIDLFSHNNTNGKPKLVNGRDIKSSTLWDIIAHHQRKVTMINVPMTYPPRPVNGYLISCFLTPKDASTFTYPPELADTLTDYVIDLDRFIDTKPYQEGGHTIEATAPSLSLLQEFRDMTEKRARTSLTLMESRDWDFFMVVFISTDRMGHYFWPYHRSPKENDSPEVQELCRAVHNHYVRLDEIVGELVAKAGEDVTVVVMSDHGMGPRYTKRVHCNYWLQQRGWLQTQTNGSSNLANLDGWLKRLGVPRDKIGRLLFRMPGLAKSEVVKKAIKSRTATPDPERSQAYFVPIYDNIAGIRINSTGERKEKLYQEITLELSKLTDPETGQVVVEKIYRGEEYYYGPYADNVPDIIVVMNPEYGFGYHLSHYSSIITKVVASNKGDHRLEGIIMATGPHVRTRPEPLTNLAIEDIGPTVLYLMGLPVPSDMDGQVLVEIIEPDVLAGQPVRLSDPVGFWPKEDEVVFSDEVTSDEGEAEILARLQALGYLE